MANSICVLASQRKAKQANWNIIQIQAHTLTERTNDASFQFCNIPHSKPFRAIPVERLSTKGTAQSKQSHCGQCQSLQRLNGSTHKTHARLHEPIQTDPIGSVAIGFFAMAEIAIAATERLPTICTKHIT